MPSLPGAAVCRACRRTLSAALTTVERTHLERISCSHTQSAPQVARANELLAVAAAQRFTYAARAAGRPNADAVAQVATRFNWRERNGGPKVRAPDTQLP